MSVASILLRKCRGCSKDLPGEEFYGSRHFVCKDCLRAKQRVYDLKRRQWAKDNRLCKNCKKRPDRGLGRLCDVCRPIHQKRSNRATVDSIKKRKIRLDEMKMNTGCMDCGYNKHPQALEFDHLPGFDKLDGVANLVGRKIEWRTIEKEIEKCEVVCRNCHAIRHFNRRLAEANDRG